jgi:hypothetical protein
MDGRDRVGDRRVVRSGGGGQVGRADEVAVDALGAEDLGGDARRLWGLHHGDDQRLPRPVAMVGGRDRAEAPGAWVGGEAPSADRRVLHHVDEGAGLSGGLDVRRDDALGALVERPEHEARLPLAGADEHRHAVHLRQGDVGPEGDHVGRAVLAVDEHEVQPGDRQHLDDVLAGHPHQRPDELLARPEPRLDRRRVRGVTGHEPLLGGRALRSASMTSPTACVCPYTGVCWPGSSTRPVRPRHRMVP